MWADAWVSGKSRLRRDKNWWWEQEVEVGGREEKLPQESLKRKRSCICMSVKSYWRIFPNVIRSWRNLFSWSLATWSLFSEKRLGITHKSDISKIKPSSQTVNLTKPWFLGFFSPLGGRLWWHLFCRILCSINKCEVLIYVRWEMSPPLHCTWAQLYKLFYQSWLRLMPH